MTGYQRNQLTCGLKSKIKPSLHNLFIFVGQIMKPLNCSMTDAAGLHNNWKKEKAKSGISSKTFVDEQKTKRKTKPKTKPKTGEPYK